MPGGGLTSVGQPGRGLGGPVGHRHQHPRPRRVAHQVVQQLDGGVVGPVHIVEDHHQPTGAGQLLQQPPYRPVQPVAGQAGQVGQVRLARRGRRQGHRRERRPQQPHRPRAEVGPVLFQMVVQGVDDRPERHVLFELGRPAGQRGQLAGPCRLRQFHQQPGLAGPRFAFHGHEPERAACRGVQRLIEGTQNVTPSHQRREPGRAGMSALIPVRTTSHCPHPNATGGRYAMIMRRPATREDLIVTLPMDGPPHRSLAANGRSLGVRDLCHTTRPPAGSGATRKTSRTRGPCTPSTRFSSMSLVADGPEINVRGRAGSSRSSASGTSATT